TKRPQDQSQHVVSRSRNLTFDLSVHTPDHMSRFCLGLAAIALVACDRSSFAATSRQQAVDSTRKAVADSTRKRAGADSLRSPIVRALYINAAHARSWKSMHHYIAIADTTEINALVIDMKDEFGLNYRTANKEFAKNAGSAGKVPN